MFLSCFSFLSENIDIMTGLDGTALMKLLNSAVIFHPLTERIHYKRFITDPITIILMQHDLKLE